MNYPQPHYGYMPMQPMMKNGLGVSSLVLGILSVLFFWVPIFGLLAYVTAGTGLILGIFGHRRVQHRIASNGGVAMAGIVLCIVGLVAVIGTTVFWSWGLAAA